MFNDTWSREHHSLIVLSPKVPIMLMCLCTRLYSIKVSHSFVSSAVAEQDKEMPSNIFVDNLKEYVNYTKIISVWDGKTVNPAT